MEVQILPHHTGEGGSVGIFSLLYRFGAHDLTCIDCLLLHSPQALTKFLKCVNWDLPQEAKQALELLGKWRPMDVEDSLELLSSQFTNPTVRRYAVARLQQADDEVGIGEPRVTRRAYVRVGGWCEMISVSSNIMYKLCLFEVIHVFKAHSNK